MDWLHTIFVCFVWIVGVVIAGISVYVFIVLPISLITYVVGFVYGFSGCFYHSFPNFGQT